MELTDILSLVKAGYTREEIEQMESPKPETATPEPVSEPVEAEAPAAEPVAVPQPTAQPLPQQAPAQDQPSLADIMQGIAKLTSAVQANAIAQSVIPQGLKTAPTAEDMLAEIIRPSYRKED